MDLLKIKQLDKKIDSFTILKHINLTVKKKEIVGLVGENGAGKTTLMKSVCGLNEIDSGRINFRGKKKDTGVLIEYPSLYNHMTASENLTFFGKSFGLQDLEHKIDELIILFGLKKSKNKTVAEYSLGMKQRLGLAVSLINDPKLLILDEPTNGLDPKGIIEIRKILLSLVEKKDISIIISSHLLSELEMIADRICFLKDGKVIDIQDKNNIRNNFKSKIIIETMEAKKALDIIKNYLEVDGKVLSSTKIELVKENLKYDKLIEVLSINKIKIENIYTSQSTLEDYYLQIEGGKS